MPLFWSRLHPQTKGIALMCMAIFLFSCMDAIAKGLTVEYPPLQVVWARYMSQTFWAFLLLSPWLVKYLRTRNLGMQLLRSALLFGSTMLFFAGFRYLGLGEVTAIFQVAPLIITILSVLILKETVGFRRWVGVALGLTGALIIIRPGTDVFTIASLLPILAAGCFAGYSISTRFLGPDESPMTSFLYTALIGTIVASLFVPFIWVEPEPDDMMLMALFGGIGGVGHLMLIYALSKTPASTLAPFTYCSLLFNTLWGYVFYGEVPDIPTYIGAIVIVGAGLYVWRREVTALRKSKSTEA